MRFLPLGGINAGNLASYAGSPDVIAVGGSWIATRELIAAKKFDAIKDLAAEAVRISRQSRQTIEIRNCHRNCFFSLSKR